MDWQDDRWQRHQDRWARRQERWARKHERWAGRHSPQQGILLGAIIIVVGTIFLLDNLHIIYAHDVWEYWPVILIVVGLSKVMAAGSQGSLVGGTIVAGIGTLFLLHNLHIFDFDWDRYWPLVLIGWGILLLTRPWHWGGPRRFGPPRPPVGATGPVGRAGAAGPGGASGTEAPKRTSNFSVFAIFGGSRRKIDSQDFRGGEAVALFGGVEIDLRSAGISAEFAVLDLNAIFGGIEVRVPETWVVEAKGAGVFGGFTDETRPPVVDPTGKAQRLIVRGAGVFGGVNIKN